CLQQRNEIMQSFFVAVNNSSKNFYPSTRCQLPQSTADHQPPNRPQTRSTLASPPLNTTTATCVSALCFAARGEY
ncbi:hypothetical protein, partial [Ralstonia edaphi]|uniref:hypothetical protein n=1 Tax=Ralstonia edaphi TaxID=3058599 RepID=UPI00292E06FA